MCVFSDHEIRCQLSCRTDHTLYFTIISTYSALGPVWQEPEPSQATGMALARCILGNFLRGSLHWFPLPFDVPTFAARCLHVSINASAPSSERWNCGREWSGNFAEMTPFLRHLGIFLHAANLRHGANGTLYYAHTNGCKLLYHNCI
jgi:hypothetical protein